MGYLTLISSYPNDPLFQERRMWESIVHILSSTMERILKEGELEQRVKTRTMELEETLEALKRSQQANSAIIKSIAHELCTPCTASWAYPNS
jgi:signal transduction histidine kinase